MKLTVKDMTYCALFAVLLAVGAFIKIPISIVPITLQTLFVVLAGLLLGKKRATVSVLLYIIIGLIGLPVFSSGGGLGYIIHPTFGYLLGFLLAAYVIGALSENGKSFIQLCIIAVFGMLLIYLCGFLYFYFIQNIYFGKGITFGWMFYYLFLVYLPGDLISCLVAVTIKQRIGKL